jgi:hypothetical protein
MIPAHAISTKNKHLLAIYPIPTRGFTAAVSVFGGTPPPKPLKLNCKIRSRVPGISVGQSWAHHTGDEFGRLAAVLVFAKFSWSSGDII